MRGRLEETPGRLEETGGRLEQTSSPLEHLDGQKSGFLTLIDRLKERGFNAPLDGL
jgi:hypothetical protein